jgi:hypothetical protein
MRFAHHFVEPSPGLQNVPQFCNFCSEPIPLALPSPNRLNAVSDSRPKCQPVAAAALDSTSASSHWHTACLHPVASDPQFAASFRTAPPIATAPRQLATHPGRAGPFDSGKSVRFCECETNLFKLFPGLYFPFSAFCRLLGLISPPTFNLVFMMIAAPAAAGPQAAAGRA